MYANLPDFSWTTRDDVCSSREEGVSNDGLENGTLSCALTSDYNNLRKDIVIDLTRNVLKLSKTCGQNVERLAHDV